MARRKPNKKAKEFAIAAAHIAQERHFFDANGLSVNAKDNYSSGVATTDALLKGDVDIVWAAEFAMVGRAFEKRPISIITSFGRFTNNFLLARKDRGVATISDLKGRKIGLPEICAGLDTSFVVDYV